MAEISDGAKNLLSRYERKPLVRALVQGETDASHLTIFVGPGVSLHGAFQS